MGLIWITLQIHLPASPRYHGHKPFPEVHFGVFIPHAPFFHSLPLAWPCRWLEAKELLGNWIQSQDNSEKNKMQVRAAPLPLPSQKTSMHLAVAVRESHHSWQRCAAFPWGERLLANKTRKTRWKASETWGYICVCNKTGPHAFISCSNCRWTLKYQIN